MDKKINHNLSFVNSSKDVWRRLAGQQGSGIEPATIARFASEIHAIQQLGIQVQLLLVVTFSGSGASKGMDRAQVTQWVCLRLSSMHLRFKMP